MLIRIGTKHYYKTFIWEKTFKFNIEKTFKFDIEKTFKFNMGKFLDIALDLRNNTYEPYRTPGNYSVSISESSNHLRTNLSELTKSISKSLSDLLSTKEISKKASPIYSEALKHSRLNEPLVFTPKTNANYNNS